MQAIIVRRVVILPAPQIYDVRIVNKNSADAYITDAYEHTETVFNALQTIYRILGLLS